ncbi:peroxisomal trans-2-enoyl-CoA reductase-like isoform X1 [Haliotis cracherodii]|uniref:peroxisomal trans-2-enoyl-CoA reductase-like isoform X1 n=2 Tax=Haliotis cracherodii TaxID=6455 RepID=UPI0039E8F921
MVVPSSKVASVFRAGLFKDRVAIVTGGGTGIGKAIALELLYLGCKVMIASRKTEQLEKASVEMCKQIDRQGRGPAQLHHVQCNIRKEEQVKNLMSATLSTYGKIDFLVNNGGGQFPSAAANISLKGWNAVVETNLTGTFLCCREVYNQWMQEHGGIIVNIIADMWKGFPSMSHTGAARSAVDNLTKSLAIEWASDGVRVNSVAPGSSIYSETAAANYGDFNIFSRNIPSVPAKRLGTTEEVSAAVCFLLSPAASFISGETLKVDAGSSIYPSMTWTIPEHKKLPAYRWDDDDDGTSGSQNTPKSKL